MLLCGTKHSNICTLSLDHGAGLLAIFLLVYFTEDENAQSQLPGSLKMSGLFFFWRDETVSSNQWPALCWHLIVDSSRLSWNPGGAGAKMKLSQEVENFKHDFRGVISSSPSRLFIL